MRYVCEPRARYSDHSTHAPGYPAGMTGGGDDRLTCHRSRNLRPACSDTEPRPRRCTPAPWSSLTAKVGIQIHRNQDPLPPSPPPFSLPSLCYCAPSSAARQHGSRISDERPPPHAKCVKVGHFLPKAPQRRPGRSCWRDGGANAGWGSARCAFLCCCASSVRISPLCSGSGEETHVGFQLDWACAHGSSLRKAKGWITFVVKHYKLWTWNKINK